jgi:hypothetical protein
MNASSCVASRRCGRIEGLEVTVLLLDASVNMAGMGDMNLYDLPVL